MSVHLAVSIGEADPLPLVRPALIENPRLLLCSLCRAVPDTCLCPGVCAARAIPAGVWNWCGVGEAIHRCALWISASLLELDVCGAVVGNPLHDLAGCNTRADLIYRSRIKAHIDDHRRARISRWPRHLGWLYREHRHGQQRRQGKDHAGCEEWADALHLTTSCSWFGRCCALLKVRHNLCPRVERLMPKVGPPLPWHLPKRFCAVVRPAIY